eukprot:TRINITY_DN4999_c0_g1_i1.p1 TRINITY_DN4999_c0_g1~~TRINITY_DN4999_c0_g1_i1.p1  ORF type:complete len:167 (+),score=31.45 TRINITY_DN4999_c0_g1_i1:91-591(+)
MAGDASRPGSSSRLSLEDLPKLSLEQLRQLKEQVEAELEQLNESLQGMKAAMVRLEITSQAVQQLSKQNAGKSLMVPLTGSLYVEGQLQCTDRVLIDVGTGYYVEKSVGEGVDYCSRRIELLKKNFEKVTEVAMQRGRVAEQVALIFQTKLRASAGASPSSSMVKE